jgi:hypothetical protein
VRDKAKIGGLPFYTTAYILANGIKEVPDSSRLAIEPVGNMNYIVDKKTCIIYGYREISNPHNAGFFKNCECGGYFKLFQGIVVCEQCQKIL